MTFRSPGQPRPAGRPIVLPRWPRFLIPVAAGVIALIIVISVIAGVWTDYLWFRSVGYTSVFSTAYGIKWLLFLVTALFMALVVGFNAWLAYRLRPAYRPVAPDQQSLEGYRTILDPHRRLMLGLLLGLIGLISGLTAAGSWRTWLLFANRSSFHTVDPQFHLDISFFVFVYPFLRMVLTYLFTAVLLALVVAALVHYLYGALRPQVKGQRATPAARAHLFVLSAVIIGGVYPAIIQQFVVKPNELVKETPYLTREIASPRRAYGVGDVQPMLYPATSTELSAQLARQVTALADVRLMDPGVVSQSFQQLQQVKSYYKFANVLSVDRYVLPGSTTPQDTLIGVRDMGGPPAGQAGWINSHLVYTHGYGAVAAPARTAQPDGFPAFTESDIPPTGQLNVQQGAGARVYFGEQETSYAIVGGHQKELDYPNQSTGGQQNTTYTGSGGVPIGSALNRLLYAIKFRQLNILLSGAIDGNSKIMYIRDPLSRVAKVAPFLTLDGDPYPVISGGQILWVVDGYTTTDDYPYSQRLGLQGATTNSYSPGGSTFGPAGEVNYIRNSVKAVVNAYTGAVTLYQWSNNDPVLETWRKAFPGIVQPRNKIPPDLLAHFC